MSPLGLAVMAMLVTQHALSAPLTDDHVPHVHPHVLTQDHPNADYRSDSKNGLLYAEDYHDQAINEFQPQPTGVRDSADQLSEDQAHNLEVGTGLSDAVHPVESTSEEDVQPFVNKPLGLPGTSESDEVFNEPDQAHHLYASAGNRPVASSSEEEVVPPSFSKPSGLQGISGSHEVLVEPDQAYNANDGAGLPDAARPASSSEEDIVPPFGNEPSQTHNLYAGVGPTDSSSEEQDVQPLVNKDAGLPGTSGSDEMFMETDQTHNLQAGGGLPDVARLAASSSEEDVVQPLVNKDAGFPGNSGSGQVLMETDQMHNLQHVAGFPDQPLVNKDSGFPDSSGSGQTLMETDQMHNLQHVAGFPVQPLVNKDAGAPGTSGSDEMVMENVNAITGNNIHSDSVNIDDANHLPVQWAASENEPVSADSEDSGELLAEFRPPFNAPNKFHLDQHASLASAISAQSTETDDHELADPINNAAAQQQVQHPANNAQPQKKKFANRPWVNNKSQKLMAEYVNPQAPPDPSIYPISSKLNAASDDHTSSEESVNDAAAHEEVPAGIKDSYPQNLRYAHDDSQIGELLAEYINPEAPSEHILHPELAKPNAKRLKFAHADGSSSKEDNEYFMRDVPEANMPWGNEDILHEELHEELANDPAQDAQQTRFQNMKYADHGPHINVPGALRAIAALANAVREAQAEPDGEEMLHGEEAYPPYNSHSQTHLTADEVHKLGSHEDDFVAPPHAEHHEEEEYF